MKVVVFGATGRTGKLLVAEALARGHHATAFARNPQSLDLKHPNLVVVQGDVLDARSVSRAMAGQDAVLCALGTLARKPGTAVSEGTRNITKAMRDFGVRRLVCLSAAGVLGDDAGFLFGRIVLPLLLRRVFAEKRLQLSVIQESGLDWVLVRPLMLTDGPRTGQYRVTLDCPSGRRVSRADVAEFMVKQIEDDGYVRKMPCISS